jgi:RHS repeat-associated protein
MDLERAGSTMGGGVIMTTPINHGLNNDQNVIVQLSYDKGGRTTSLRDPRGHLTTYTYDALDRRTSLTNPLNQTWTTSHEDLPDGSRTTLSHPNGYDVTREFDLLGRLNAINYGEAATTPDVRFFYDASGNRTRMTEYGGAGYTDPVRETSYSYDRVRRLSAVAFDTDGDSNAEQTVAYAYDAGGRRTRLTLPGGRDVHYQYDAKGQLIGLTDWDDQATEYDYDSAGRLIAAERDNGLRSRYVYDAAGRLRVLRHSAGDTLLGHFAYKVDQRGNRTEALEILKQPGAGSPKLIDYDDVDLVTKGNWTEDTVNNLVTSDGVSARLSLLFMGNEATLSMGEGPDHSIYDVYIGHALWQSFDGYAATEGERQIVITLDGEGPHVLEIRNRADRNLQSSGYVVRFKQLVVPDWAYDAHTIAYEYDTLSRLRDARYGAGLNADAATANLLRRYQYSYDLAGNRLAETVTVGGAPVTTPYSYNVANQLVSDGTHTLTYDLNGNLTSDGMNAYTWDRANRLLGMGGLSYAYDGLGNRVQQSSGVDVTQYLLDVQPGLAVVLSATTGADTARYVHGPRGIDAQQDNAGAWRWMVQDGLGSVRGVADSTLTLLESRQYAPYGETYGVASTSQTAYGFTGEPTDANELVYLRARYLNPALGVFASLDPWEGMAQRPMSLNGNSWVEGNVVNLTDPSGRQVGTICREAALSFPGVIDDGLCTAVDALLNLDQTVQGARHFAQSVNAIFAAPVPAWNPVLIDGVQYFGVDANGTIYIPVRPLSYAEVSILDQQFERAVCGAIAPGQPGSCVGAPGVATPVPGEVPYFGDVGLSDATYNSLQDGVCILPMSSDRESRIDNLVNAAQEAQRNTNYDIVYRAPGDGEHPLAMTFGFFPKSPFKAYTPIFHITSGSRYPTQYISLTRSVMVAKRYQEVDPIYVINLREVVGLVLDFTIPHVRDTFLGTSFRAYNYARDSEEVLVAGWIPPVAIKGLIP